MRNSFESPGGTDKNTIHNYTGIYAELLKPYLNKVGTLLEIGVQHGGSSLLWHEYLPGFRLFPSAHSSVNSFTLPPLYASPW